MDESSENKYDMILGTDILIVLLLRKKEKKHHQGRWKTLLKVHRNYGWFGYVWVKILNIDIISFTTWLEMFDFAFF